MSTLDIREVLDGISEACSMIVYFYIWNLTWINIGRIEETTKYCEWNWGICYYCYYYFFIDALWDPALHCSDFVCEFELLLYWPFHTYSLYICIYILPLCSMPHLLIFLWCSVAFVILPVSILLVFMPLFSETCPFFYCSSLTEDPLGLLPAHSVAGARSPRYTIKFLTTCLLQFFIFYYSFCA